MKESSELIERIRRHPLLVSVDDFEIFVSRKKELSVHFRDGEQTHVMGSGDLQVGLRLIHRKQPGFASVTSSEATDLLVESALASARSSSVDPWFRFPLMHTGEHEFPQWDGEFKAVEPHYSKLGEKPHVFEERHGQHSHSFTFYRNSEKRHLSYANRTETLQFEAIDKGSTHVFRLVSDYESSDLAEDTQLTQAFQQKLLAQRASQPWIGSGEIPTILGPRALCQILNQISDWFCADQIQQMKSPLYEGDLQASAIIHLVDEGTFRGSRNSAPFDSEGVRCERTDLLREGKTVGYLFDSGTGARANRPSTGNRFWAPGEAAPRVRPVQLRILPGERLKKQLLSNMRSGVYLESWDSLQLKSPTELRVVGTGWKIQNGQPEHPLRGVKSTINPMTFLGLATEVGRDLEFHESCAAPSILFSSLPLKH